jgi:hypothetical protein
MPAARGGVRLLAVQEQRMGAFLYVCLDGELPSVAPGFLQGDAIGEEFEDLDRLARQLGLAPHSTFLSLSQDQIERFELEGTDLSEQWFEPSQGLATIDGLMAHLRQTAAEADDETDQALEELKAVKRILEQAKVCGVRFQFSGDPD